MIRLVVPILILLLLLTGAVWALRGFKLPQFALAPMEQEATPSSNKRDTDKTTPEEEAAATTSGPAGDQKAGDSQAPASDPNASFDIARIDPKGVSVFAGRAEPGARVTVMGDGQAIGTAEADDNGEWTLATEHEFADADPKLALRTKSAAQAEAEDKAEAARRAKEKPIVAAEEDKSRSSGATAVTSQMLENLRGMVNDARNESEANEVAAASPEQMPQDSDDDSVETDHAAAVKAALPVHSEPSPVKSVPLPIMFVFNEATMTDEGREAASLLLQYLKLKHFGAITLTGHADERGTNALNMSLSSERLETVAQFLKDNGYEGRLTLVPKGETEPFTGVDRDEFSQDDLYQLDRRVELVVTP